MRISDWSSDVCSSDLEPERSGQARRPPLERRRFGLERRVRLERWAALRRPHPVAGAEALGQRLAQRPEIGKASGRGRGVEYVSISVVAGTLKKKDIVRIRIAHKERNYVNMK